MATVTRTAVSHPAAPPSSFPAAPPSSFPAASATVSLLRPRWRGRWVAVAVEGGGDVKKRAGANSNYVVPMDDRSFSSIARPLEEILRDLNRRIPEKIVGASPSSPNIPWYQANRMLSFNAPGWCGEIRDVIFAESGSVTVVYRVTIRGTDGEAHRESTGTVSAADAKNVEDPVAAAEEIAFCRACARFGLGLYLYHEE